MGSSVVRQLVAWVCLWHPRLVKACPNAANSQRMCQLRIRSPGVGNVVQRQRREQYGRLFDGDVMGQFETRFIGYCVREPVLCSHVAFSLRLQWLAADADVLINNTFDCGARLQFMTV